MKLATLKDSTRDGRLVVVSRDLTRCTDTVTGLHYLNGVRVYN